MQSRDEILKLARKLIKKHNLGMKLLNVSLDRENQPVFFFSAPTRVDFRALVADLNRELNTKVDLRQVGARDEAKYIGGLGICGRKLCCASWLPHIPNVPTKLIQKQNLEGSPGQYTGVCGKLLCCLVYETGDFQLTGSGKWKGARCEDGKFKEKEVKGEKSSREEPSAEKIVDKGVKDKEEPRRRQKARTRRIVRKLKLRKKK